MPLNRQQPFGIAQTHVNTSEPLRSPQEHHSMPQNVHEPFRTTQKKWERLVTLQNPLNVKEDLRTFRNFSDLTRTPHITSVRHKTLLNFEEPLRTAQIPWQWPECLKTLQNVQEHLKTSMNPSEPMRNHQKAIKHTRMLENASEP